MFIVNFVEGNSAEAKTNGGMQIGFDTLLLFEFLVRDGVSPDTPGGALVVA
jgi:hypothetical protein